MEISKNLKALIEKLKSRQQTVAFAESCTGGLLSATITSVSGVSDIFMGSVVSYAYQAKVDLLGVSMNALKLDGAVSERIAKQMALGAKKNLKSDWAVSITGVAGPTGGSVDKPVGTVWFSACGPGFEATEKKLFSGSRTEIQQKSAEFAVDLLLRGLNN